MSSFPPKTRWFIRALTDPITNEYRRGLAVTMTVDTDAKAILDAIEKAAMNNGIELVRAVDPEEGHTDE